MYKIEGTNCISDKYTPKILNKENKSRKNGQSIIIINLSFLLAIGVNKNQVHICSSVHYRYNPKIWLSIFNDESKSRKDGQSIVCSLILMILQLLRISDHHNMSSTVTLLGLISGGANMKYFQAQVWLFWGLLHKFDDFSQTLEFWIKNLLI